MSSASARKATSSKSNHRPGSVRHAEKRRTGTCQFADRISRKSLDTYRQCVPATFREQRTCIATVVAHFASDGHLQVMSLGVGTKFLTEKALKAQDEANYGVLVRDSHAEVLARRAFCRQISLEIKRLRNSDCISKKEPGYRPILRETLQGRFDLVSGVTLHFYCSSAPCGNATLKKFTKMTKEQFDDSLGPNEWPCTPHEPIPGHALNQGQFSLLVKRDPFAGGKSSQTCRQQSQTNHKIWPANKSDDWCPPGTSIVHFQKGSLHTCSDKICRWNCLGLQGSLLASLLDNPLYISTITVGRKLTGCICRRAVCCRAYGFGGDSMKQNAEISEHRKYTVHHPAIMGTGVYMDDAGVIDMTGAATRDQDVRFHSSLSWAWWPWIDDERSGIISFNDESNLAECIDGTTGLVRTCSLEQNEESTVSSVSTLELVRLFDSLVNLGGVEEKRDALTLNQLLELKRRVSSDYELAKDELLSKHRIFRQWKRRGQLVT